MTKAQQTRKMILQKAFELVYANGYQITSIDQIIATTQVTKGAFYYHFRTKEEMGLAIIEEIIKPAFLTILSEQQKSKQNSLDTIYGIFYGLLIKNDFLNVQYGCPVANFIQEMAHPDTDFGVVLDQVTQQWLGFMTTTIQEGKTAGYIAHDVVAKEAALFIISGYWGVRNFGKLTHNKATYLPYLKGLKHYLKTLELKK